MSFSHRQRITKLLHHLQIVDAELRALKSDSDRVPSPIEMQALAKILYLLRELPQLAETCETNCWQRIKKWQATPYTRFQQSWRIAVKIISLWIFLILGFYSSFLWMLQSFFAEKWQLIAVDAGLAFIVAVLIKVNLCNCKFTCSKCKCCNPVTTQTI